MTNKIASVFAVLGLYGIENCLGETLGAQTLVGTDRQHCHDRRRRDGDAHEGQAACDVACRAASRSPSSNGTGK